MKWKEKWAYDHLIAKNRYHPPVDKNVDYIRDEEIYLAGFELARQKIIEMLQMPAKDGIKEIINLGEKEL